MLASASTFTGVKVAAKATVAKTARRANVVTRAGQYDDELLQTAVRRFFSFLLNDRFFRRASPVRGCQRQRVAWRVVILDAWMVSRPIARSRVARRRMRMIERETNRGIFTSKRIPRASLSRADGSTTTGRRRRRRDDASVAGRPWVRGRGFRFVSPMEENPILLWMWLTVRDSRNCTETDKAFDYSLARSKT